MGSKINVLSWTYNNSKTFQTDGAVCVFINVIPKLLGVKNYIHFNNKSFFLSTFDDRIKEFIQEQCQKLQQIPNIQDKVQNRYVLFVCFILLLFFIFIYCI